MKKFILLLSFLMVFATVLNAGPEEKFEIVDAVMNSPKLSLDGQAVKVNGYVIKGSNYFRIRDIAAIVSSTDRKFDVGFDKDQNMVSIELGKAYSGSKDLFTPKNSKAKGESRETICLVDNHQYPLESVLIDGNNYVKLRDLGNIAGFSVDYDKDKGEVVIKTIFKDHVETEEYNEYDDVKKLLKVSPEAVKNLNNSVVGDYKLEVESKGDGIKFYVNHDGKRERFYLNTYYGEESVSKIYGEPEEIKELGYYKNSRNTIKFLDELNENLDKAGRENLKVELPVYNYIYFVDKNRYTDNLSIRLGALPGDLYGVSENGIKLPLAFGFYNRIGAAANTVDIDGVSEDNSGMLRTNVKIVPLGSIFPYSIKENGETKKFSNDLLLDFDRDTRLLVIDYVISGVNGKILVYYVD